MPGTLSRLALTWAVVTMSLTGAAIAAPLSTPTRLVTGPINDAVTVTLTKELPHALQASRDLGVVPANAMLPHIRLTLKRPAYLQAALDSLTHDQRVRGTASYHRWLTPAQLRAYGPAQADITAVVGWLNRHGLTVNSVSPSGMSIDFGGTAANVGATFHTQLHNVLRAGAAHVANVTAPAIPAALAPVVTGATLANFFPRPQMVRATPSLTVSSGPASFYAVAPTDFATIYNLNPLRGSFNFFGRPIVGDGVTVAVVEQTLIQASDWNRFRQVFGLSGYTGTLTLSQPGSCTSPGFTGDEGEAALDAEWSDAVAPNANIIEASCAGSEFTFGVETTLENLLEKGTPATILSISYGGAELANGFSFVVGWNNLLEEGAAEGKAIFVSSGDSGAAAGEEDFGDGLDVNGLADSAYNVSVGGTDFYDTALNENTKYWHKGNSNFDGSAISYIPEIPWNNSCASPPIWEFEKFSGEIAFCNSPKSAAVTQNGIGGTGGVSDYFTKPDWQLTSVLGMPNDGLRDQPDVSLFAANGIWNHFYVFCMSDANEGGNPCSYTTANALFGNAAGGTSFAAPAFAGIAALVQQSLQVETGAPQLLGNPAPIFYQIASAQFSTPIGFSKCNSTLGNKISGACVFNYVTVGNNAEPCDKGSRECETTSQSTQGIGVMGTIFKGKNVFAYPAEPGYSLATGLGTVNVSNLIYNYDSAYP
jgi:subtilase family serine protease